MKKNKKLKEMFYWAERVPGSQIVQIHTELGVIPFWKEWIMN